MKAYVVWDTHGCDAQFSLDCVVGEFQDFGKPGDRWYLFPKKKDAQAYIDSYPTSFGKRYKVKKVEFE